MNRVATIYSIVPKLLLGEQKQLFFKFAQGMLNDSNACLYGDCNQWYGYNTESKIHLS